MFDFQNHITATFFDQSEAGLAFNKNF